MDGFNRERKSAHTYSASVLAAHIEAGAKLRRQQGDLLLLRPEPGLAIAVAQNGQPHLLQCRRLIVAASLVLLLLLLLLLLVVVLAHPTPADHNAAHARVLARIVAYGVG